MTSNVREGDFESILDDDTLEDASQNLDDVISDSDSLTQAGQQGVEGEGRRGNGGTIADQGVDRQGQRAGIPDL